MGLFLEEVMQLEDITAGRFPDPEPRRRVECSGRCGESETDGPPGGGHPWSPCVFALIPPRAPALSIVLSLRPPTRQRGASVESRAPGGAVASAVWVRCGGVAAPRAQRRGADVTRATDGTGTQRRRRPAPQRRRVVARPRLAQA